MKSKSLRPWLVMLGCCITSFFCTGLVMNTAGLYFPAIMNEFNASSAQVSMTMTIMMFAMVFSSPFIAPFIQKVNLKIFLSVMILIASGGYFLCSVATSMSIIYIANVLIGIGTSLFTGFISTVLLGNWFKKKLGFILGVVAAVSGLAGAAFNPIISAIIQNRGWRTSYLTVAIILAMTIVPAAIFLLKFYPTEGERAYGDDSDGKSAASASAVPTDGMTFKEAVKNPVFYILTIAGALLGAVGGNVQQVSMHLTSSGYDLTTAASIVSAIMIGVAIGKIVLGALLDTKRPSVFMLLYMLFGAVGWIGTVCAVGNQILLYTFGLFIGMGQAVLLVAVPFYTRKVYGGREFSKISAVSGILSGLVPAIYIVVVGAVFDSTGSFAGPFMLSGAFFCVCVPAILLAYLMRSKQLAEQATEMEVLS